VNRGDKQQDGKLPPESSLLYKTLTRELEDEEEDGEEDEDQDDEE
jgi:hypothetical protein